MNTQFPILSAILFLPLVVALSVLFLGKRRKAAHTIGIVTSGLTLAGTAVIGFLGIRSGFSWVEEAPWIPSLDSAYRVGVDGVSYPLVLMTTALFFCCFVFSKNIQRKPAAWVSLGLLLETACIGVFVALDLLVFYVFFEITLVGMYFIITEWGHEDRKKAGLLFFLYTLVGSLFLLLALLSLYLHSDPRTFDMRELIATPPLASGTAAGLTFWALVLGFAIKTPIFPFHTWLPKAHTAAPAAGSAILAGVLLKLGAYGFIRFALQIMPLPFDEYANIIMVLAVISAVYGALLALAQTDIKRMVAYTSVNHMGYFLFGVAMSAMASADARATALAGSTLQMVSHGVVTGMLFLLVGSVQDRTQTREMSTMYGLIHSYPRLSALFLLGAFASLGLPGLAHFPAEFQIFLGGFAVSPIAVLFILSGLAITAALYLRSINSVFLGKAKQGITKPDLTAREAWSIGPLAVFTIALGVYPAPLLNLIHATTQSIGTLVQ